MLLGIDENGFAKEVRVTDEGAILVESSGGGGESTSTETTLRGSVETLGTTATTISIGKKVTSIDIANYSDEATITMAVGQQNIVIGPNIAANVPVNKNITSISLTASAANTKAQIIIKGVE